MLELRTAYCRHSFDSSYELTYVDLDTFLASF
jgi:hypothetical protein